MEYRDALAYLRDLTTFGMNFGLERINRLLALVGEPHNKLNVIHIGGTNGKGSTARMLSTILTACGYRTGIFTSPHIHSYRERFQVDGEMIAHSEVVELILMLKPMIEKMVEEGFEHPTEFEVNTAMAFVYFHKKQVDFLILEVGLGGEIDSTNVVENPLMSIITNVAMDHMDYLGNTIEEIARVKAGIIKSGCPVISGVESPSVVDVIKREADRRKSSLYLLGKDFHCTVEKMDDRGSVFSVETMHREYQGLYVPLLGEHQGKNLALALAALDLLIEKGATTITDKCIRAGLKKVYWPARMEILHRRPTIIVDVAHNVDGILSLKNSLETIFKGKRMVLLIGMLADKEREKVVSYIAPLADHIIVTKPLSPRTGDWETLKDMAEKYCANVTLDPSIEGAITTAQGQLDDADMLVVTGSFYMVSEARKILMNKYPNKEKHK